MPPFGESEMNSWLRRAPQNGAAAGARPPGAAVGGGVRMRYLHTMVRVRDLDAALDFYCAKLGLAEVSRVDNQAGRFTLVFLAAPGDAARDQPPMVELTYNWDPETYTGGRNF